MSIVGLVLSILSLAPYLSSSTEVVRMRNALLLEENNASFDWTPANLPNDFLLERGPPDPIFVNVVNHLGLAQMASDWDRAIAISRHLLGGGSTLSGGAIQSDLRTTYYRIVSKGDGYCGDFTRVFSALAIAAGIPVRSWAFSFDGFGGHGHVWPEIWNRQLQRWQLIDIFDNYYFSLSDGVALSALEFRRAMKEYPRELHLVPLHSEARPGYVIEDKAWDYYRRGLPEWYLYWGNNVFSYDHAFLVRNFSHISRSLEQMSGIIQGVSPGIRILEDSANRTQLVALIHVRRHLFFVSILAALMVIGGSICCYGLWRIKRQRLRPLA